MYERTFINEEMKRIVGFREDREIVIRGFVHSFTNVVFN